MDNNLIIKNNFLFFLRPNGNLLTEKSQEEFDKVFYVRSWLRGGGNLAGDSHVK